MTAYNVTLPGPLAPGDTLTLTVPAATVPTPPPPPPPVTTYAPAPSGAVVLQPAAGDQSAAFAALLANNVGKAVALVPGATYLMDTRTQVSLAAIDVYGQGATIKSQGFYAPGSPDSWLRLVTCRSVRIRDIILRGPAPANVASVAWPTYGWARENWRGIIIDGGHDIGLERVDARYFWGDCLYIGRRDNSTDAYATPDGITLTDCTFSDAGRNAASLVAGKNVLATRTKFANAGLCAWDTEPNLITDITDGVKFVQCDFRGGDMARSTSASHDSKGNGYVAMLSAGKAPCRNYVLDRCTFDKGAIYAVAAGGRNSGIAITGCAAATAGDATFGSTDLITFSGNTNIAKVGP
jgi:hypothetical protein